MVVTTNIRIIRLGRLTAAAMSNHVNILDFSFTKVEKCSCSGTKCTAST